VQQDYHNGTRPNQISPSQRGYRDGWRPGNAYHAFANAPYERGTWGYQEWAKAYRAGERDRLLNTTQ
jgi:hypothetical protein